MLWWDGCPASAALSLLSCWAWNRSKAPGPHCHQEMKGKECVKHQIGVMERDQTLESSNRKERSNPLAA